MDAKVVGASIASITECLRNLTWVKSDLASIRSFEYESLKTNKSGQQQQASSKTFSSTMGPQATSSNTFGFTAAYNGSNPAELSQTTKNNNSFVFGPANQQTSFSNPKRRIDILSTPQFAEVIRYLMAFSNYSEILSLLWNIADGPFYKEDIDVVSNYIKVLKSDVESRPVEKAST